MATVVDEVITRYITQGDRGTEASFGRMAVAAGVVGAAVSFMGKAVMEAAHDQASFTRAVGNFKGRFPLAEMEAFTGSLERLTGIEDDKIADTLGLLGTFQLNRQDAQALAMPILNANQALAASGSTLSGLAMQVGKAIQTGEAGGLRRAGIVIDELGFKSLDTAGRVQVLKRVLQAQGGNAAVAFRETNLGRIQALSTAVAGLIGEIGKASGGPVGQGLELMIGFVNATKDLVTQVDKAPPAIKALAQVVGVAAVGALIRYSFAANAAAFSTLNLGRAQAGLGLGILGKGGLGQTVGGLAAVAGGFAVSPGGNDTSFGGGLQRIGSRAMMGAGIGFMRGGLIPAAIGGVIGGGVGAVESIAGGPLFNKGGKAGGGTSPEAEILARQTAILEQIAKNTGSAQGGGSHWALKSARMLGP